MPLKALQCIGVVLPEVIENPSWHEEGVEQSSKQGHDDPSFATLNQR